MIAVISMTVQLVALVCGVYLIFSEGFWTGVGLIAIVVALHLACSQLSNGLLYLHQKTMSNHELEELESFARIGLGSETAPRAWHYIGNGCALLFWVSASAAIYWFVSNSF